MSRSILRKPHALFRALAVLIRIRKLGLLPAVFELDHNGFECLHSRHSKIRRWCPGFSGSMRVKTICVPHLEQGSRAVESDVAVVRLTNMMQPLTDLAGVR